MAAKKGYLLHKKREEGKQRGREADRLIESTRENARLEVRKVFLPYKNMYYALLMNSKFSLIRLLGKFKYTLMWVDLRRKVQTNVNFGIDSCAAKHSF